MSTTTTDLRLADRIWLTVAMLHERFPETRAFSKLEIREELERSGLGAGTNPLSINAHLKQHLVANVAPSTGKYTMLFQTEAGTLRLYRPGDFIDPGRRSGRAAKHMPKREEIPSQYHRLLDWYEEWIGTQTPTKPVIYEDDPLIRLIGSGEHIWADEHADEYVENLRREDV